MVPENSTNPSINLDSDTELGSLVSRNGTTIIGSQIVNNKPVLGVHDFRDSVGSGDKLFAVVSDGTNNDIYDAVAGTKSLQDDTKDLKTRFLTYLDSCLRLNGTDAAKYWSGAAWISTKSGVCTFTHGTEKVNDVAHGLSNGELIKFSTTGALPAELSVDTAYYVINKADDNFEISLTSGGSAVSFTDDGSATTKWELWDTFDLTNIPSGVKYMLEFRDRVYVAGSTADPDRVDISGIADSDTRTISWTDDNSFIVFEQEDGGGGITGLAKVPGYILVFKKRTLKRYDGASAYPEDMVNQGAPSQESIVTAKGICFWVNENGAWASTGGDPKKISTFSVDSVIKSCSAANLLNVASGTDEEHIFWSFASVTINGETHTNVVLKYNIFQNTWDIRKYPTAQRCYTKYVSGDDVYLVFGDDDGNVQKLDTGNTDNGTAISYSMETQDWDFGLRMFQKGISRFAVITENVSKGTLMWRNTHNEEDWQAVGTINNEIEEFSGMELKGNFFKFKITETVTTGPAKILGFEFPPGIATYDNTK